MMALMLTLPLNLDLLLIAWTRAAAVIGTGQTGGLWINLRLC